MSEELPVSEWNAQQYSKRVSWLRHSSKKVDSFTFDLKCAQKKLERVTKPDAEPITPKELAKLERKVDDCQNKIEEWERKVRENQWVIAQIESLYPSQRELLEQMADEAHGEFLANAYLRSIDYKHASRIVYEPPDNKGPGRLEIPGYRKMAEEYARKTERLNRE